MSVDIYSYYVSHLLKMEPYYPPDMGSYHPTMPDFDEKLLLTVLVFSLYLQLNSQFLVAKSSDWTVKH